MEADLKFCYLIGVNESVGVKCFLASGEDRPLDFNCQLLRLSIRPTGDG